MKMTSGKIPIGSLLVLLVLLTITEGRSLCFCIHVIVKSKRVCNRHVSWGDLTLPEILSPNRKKSEGVGDGTALPLHPDREPSDWSSHRDGGDHYGQFTLWRNWDHVSPPQKYFVHKTSLYSDVKLSNGMEIFPWTLLEYEKWLF